MDTTTRIKDTGLDAADGTQIYTPYKSGAWINVHGFQLLIEGNVAQTDKLGYEKSDDSTLEYSSNDITMLHPPRITLRGTVKDAESVQIADIWNLRKTKGVKRLSGGINSISAIKDGTDTYDYINVIITNVTLSESYSTDNKNVTITIQMVQV